MKRWCWYSTAVKKRSFHSASQRTAVVCVCPPPVSTPLWKQAEATVMPKLVEGGDVLTPEQVLEDIERCLERGEFLSLPGKGTRFGYLMRRFLPGQIWKHTHKVEGF